MTSTDKLTIANLRRTISKQKNALIGKRAEIRSLKLMLLKMRNQIDYRLEHGRSNDTGYSTRRHSREPKQDRKGRGL